MLYKSGVCREGILFMDMLYFQPFISDQIIHRGNTWWHNTRRKWNYYQRWCYYNALAPGDR